ncbi:Hypothetical protein LBF_1695 [Leptospira biflexa serovar Patoc strain 'Patoc 1 (Ames)']|uniref:Uncharacterized protein n=1 Tax=Leptospira biflexa serovar Patoc (strain Patoc 1 / ATCC 23582 / Paris) TaxID=456481 RepID=B0SRQ9_LEPBP|nr:hypothetical protein [Leptospira biflexa]ABZ94202.1 Hypothetical protein LBF_1695 [Leptospira biflexa serovar Patoc strain 'Patoc 1 (Ames)']ABZ97854.1 Conserved hypothetical protein [Leptospira biflexa serovar Patoc strain 'Patoc 1 (Paris)']
MGDFDNTKRAIGVGKLDDSQRKDMFNKFKSAGGEVIKEKTPPKEDDSKKSRPEPKIRQSTVSRGSDEGRSGSRGGSGSSGNNSKQDSNSLKSQADSKAQYEKEISSFAARFSIKLKCWLARVTSFGSSDLTPKFMHDFSIRGKQALIELQYSGNELLANQQYSPQLSKALDRINPLLVELLAMGQKLYNGPELTDITEPIMTAPESPVAIERVKTQIYSLFKRMYILYPYQETLKKSFSQAYDELQKLEGKPSLIYANKKRKVLQEIDTLFDGFFDRLYLVVIRAENKNIPLVSRYMENLLGITPEEKPGQRKSGENVPGGKPVETKEEKDAEAAAKEEEKKEEEEVPLSKEHAYGLRLMQMYSIPKLRKKFDPKNEYANIPDADKALLALFYFYEFDDEYSFVMTTKKIDIKPGSINGVKVDYRQKMLDIYESTRTIIDQFRIYHDILRELEKHKANPGANYIEASKKLTGIEQKRTGQSRTVRMAIKEFSLKSRDSLLTLIKDMKGKKEIVANMNDVLTLDSMESRKRLNKKPVKQCIMEAYCYLLALHDRIEAGDLYGGLVELTPEQMKASFGVDSETAKETGSPDASDLENDTQTESNGKTKENPAEEVKSAELTDEQTNDSLDDLSDDDILPTGNPF